MSTQQGTCCVHSGIRPQSWILELVDYEPQVTPTRGPQLLQAYFVAKRQIDRQQVQAALWHMQPTARPVSTATILGSVFLSLN